MGGSSKNGGSVSHHPRRGSRAASSSTFPYGLYRQKEYLPLLTTTGRAGRAPEKLLLPLTFGGGNAKLSAFFPLGAPCPETAAWNVGGGCARMYVMETKEP